MRMLALETSTEACSVALWVDGAVRERHEVAPRRHTELVLPWCDALLAEAGVAKSSLDAIAVGRGPGAFTGVRLAVALAQGMALALDRPVLPVSTLATLAMRAPAADGADILAVIDARMGEFYLGLFERTAEGRVAPLGEEALWSPAQATKLALTAGPLVGIGSGFHAEAWRGLVASSVMLDCDAEGLPHAADVARLAAAAWLRGEAVAPDQLEPAYLRDKVALTSAEQALARAAK